MASSFFPVLTSSVAHAVSSLSSVMGSTEEQRTIWLLGTPYGPIADTESRWGEYSKFLKDFNSRLWFTYRSGFEAIPSTSLTSDTGWGCMLRSGQMLLGETLIRHFLGKEFRLGYNRKQVAAQYTEIVSWFFDRMNAESPFSLHRIAILGKQYGKEIGEWFGPATISSVIQGLVQGSPISQKLAVYVPSDGVVYKDSLAEACCGVRDASLLTRPTESWKSVLILIPLRLGLESVNSIYEEGVKDCLKMPHCVGIAGGRPNSSLFFIGLDGDYLLYLDPHFTRPVIEFRSPDQFTEQDLQSFHCSEVKKIHISKIDPSLLLGFYCQTKEEVQKFLENVQAAREGKTSVFSVDNEAPVYNDTVNLEQLEDDDASDFD